MPLHLTRARRSFLRAHAATDYPHECCGFLIGRHIRRRTTIVRRVLPAANTRADSPRTRFEIDPGTFVKADRAARAEGLTVVGFYHSHPDATAQPSEYDREHAWPGYCYVIVSVRNGCPQEMNNWLLRDDRSQFDPDPITFL